MRDREEGAEEEGGSLGSAVSMLRGALSFLDLEPDCSGSVRCSVRFLCSYSALHLSVSQEGGDMGFLRVLPGVGGFGSGV